MNKEGVIKYNELLIMYLNDFVNGIERKSDLKDRSINDAIEKLERLLLEFNITIDKGQIRQVIDNSFVMYSNILKTFFDNAGIHRIDESLSISEIARDMNEVTTNLSKAVNDINKTPEYTDMINKIKGTILYLISQTNSNYVGHEYDVDQILNDAIGTFYSIYSDTLINDFSRDKLPELFKICDELNYANTNIDTIDEAYPNEDRDNFINKTMEVEIKEGMKDGKVTLTIVDSMGNRTELIGNAAIEKLKSYNQLYESSNPGRKADTSNWPDEPYETPQNVQLREVPTQVMDPTPQQVLPVPQQPVQQPIQQPVNISNDFNDLTAPSNLTKEEESKNENEEMIKNFLNQYKNDTLSTPSVDYVDNNVSTPTNLTAPVNAPMNNTPAPSFIDNPTEKTNSFLPSFEDTVPRNKTYGDEFIGNYSNPNYDRDQFIKLTTGIEIQEDVDHQGRIFLRVIEPTGREVIYSGKEAVRMIQNYNQTYLDANPDKKVDTTLIDNYKE